MIGIAKKNLNAEVFQNILGNAFYRSQCPYGHENGRFDFAMRGEQAAEAAWTRSRINLKLEGH